MIDQRSFLLFLSLFLSTLAFGQSQEQTLIKARKTMVDTQLKARDIGQKEVLLAMEQVPRHLFVDEAQVHLAYADFPLSIGHKQTISQPYIVAFMSEAAQVKAGDKVLEIGTGSGYQAAILGQMGIDVYTIEIIPELAKQAQTVLKEKLKLSSVHCKVGDGYQGWPEQAPFDAIIVTAAPPHVPIPLIGQLKEGGRLIVPVGVDNQELLRITKDIKAADGYRTQKLLPVRFVPMVGKAQHPKG